MKILRTYLLISIACALLFVSCKDSSTSVNVVEEDNDPERIIEEAFPGQTGEVVEFNIGGEQLVLEKFGDQYVFQGDIIISEMLLNEMSNKQVNKFGIGELFGVLTWPNNTVPYEFSSDISDTYIDKANMAMEMISKHSKVVFKERRNETYYVLFKQNSNRQASASLGLDPFIKEHEVNFDPAWFEAGSFAHELLHILGIVHEHTRSDRDDYVTVYSNNIQSCSESNFRRHLSFMPDAGYDYNSIMHYGSYACLNPDTDKVPENATILTTNGEEVRANRSDLSEKDIQQINELYPDDIDSYWPRDTDTEVVDVTNPATGRTWMDRNLGASRAATAINDSEAYGDLYQWGRPADGHQKRTSGTTNMFSVSNQPLHGDFILTSNSPHDWRNPKNDDLWQGVDGMNNPCPIGYRLPTMDEWRSEYESWSSPTLGGAFHSPLKLPSPGRRMYDGTEARLIWLGTSGTYWSSTVEIFENEATNNSVYLFYIRSEGSMGDAGGYVGRRSVGASVRCIKD